MTALDPRDPVALTQALIRCPSVTPQEAGVLDLLAGVLEPLGFAVTRMTNGAPPDAPVENLFARRGGAGPHFAFAGHVDVVPPGDADLWGVDPFAAEIRDGFVIGRGACDMKGGLAAFVAAVARLGPVPTGAISLIITGDEEGPALHGTRALLDWMRAQGHQPDACLVGEPTSAARLGDMMKIGRRGSINAWITVRGVQGHVAYPHRADNPVPRLVRILDRLMARRLDGGSEFFQPSNLEVTDLEVGNKATNIIPATAHARINIRFNDLQSGAELEGWIRDTVAAETSQADVRVVISGEAFRTPPGPLSQRVAQAVERVTGLVPEASTSGGTSDARFIHALCPVVEFGLPGATMHKADERVALDDLEHLTQIYEALLRDWLSGAQT